MNIALCYESVIPGRGGCETYIADLARRLAADRHQVHLYACRWDDQLLPGRMHFHQIPPVSGPRFLRPWRFGERCLEELRKNQHDVSLGFDKTWGQDILYPMGGLHAASAAMNLQKYRSGPRRWLARLGKFFDLAHRSYLKLERQQYLTQPTPTILVNSDLVRRHFQTYYGIAPETIEVVHSAIDLNRFPQHDRLKKRLEGREKWGMETRDAVGLFVARNFRLKGLEPLLYGIQGLVRRAEFRLSPPPLRVLIAGSDGARPFQRLAKKLGITDHVRFLGNCPDIRMAFFAADFLVHPTFYDPCSLVVLEALACDLPVITTRHNGACEFIDQGQEGFVLDDPHDHGQLTEYLGNMLDPALRKSCSQAARLRGQRWTFEEHYRALLGVFEKAAAKKKAA